MIHIKNVLNRVTPLGAAGALLVSAAIPAITLSRIASADPLTERSLRVSSTIPNDDVTAPDGTTYSSLPAGDPRNGAKVDHTYTFKVATTGNIQGFTIEYCETAFGFVGEGACDAPDLLNGGTGGFDASAWNGATVPVTDDGGSPVNFTVAANEDNFLTLTHATGLAAVAAGSVIAVNFEATDTNYFVNPHSDYKNPVESSTNGTYFAHVQTFADDELAGDAFEDEDDTPAGVIDDGTVTNNITTGIGLYTRVQETLNFSVEGEQTVPQDGPSVLPGQSCAPLTESGQIKMGDTNHALATAYAYDAYSYFRLSTNSSNGVTVAYSGDTLKTASGLDINAASPGPSTPGTEQFGLAIDATGSSMTQLAPTTNYGNGAGDAGLEGEAGPIAANVAFSTGSITTPVAIAQTTPPTTNVVNCDTGAVRYIANISPDTPAGIYQTKINYIASPKY